MWRVWLFNLILFCSTPLFAQTPDKQAKPEKSTLTETIGVGDYFQVLVGLLVVVIAIVAMAWMIKRIGYIQTGTQGALKVIGGLSIGQREKLVLVQVGKQQLLLGVAPGNISKLHELDEPIDTETTSPQPGNFYDKLQSVLKGERK